VIDVAIYRAPRTRVRRRGTITDSACRAMELAALALTDAVPGLTGDEALAMRERLRQRQLLMDEPQACLPLGVANGSRSR